ncbi:hypothetical protein A2625_01040 [candidate division WOR-1 bacterium RIFCSPHIGHO2_01_FULL_53_15]|uniref:Beta-glucanase n=1 Tax=candidate division WOR-1 bacterium RIFCSPHIGHO2_01_FULL_53_15 TaxID=1802564 RepID=A0A1F4Q0V2_UNCSA|nr:MAG: hypothetical protein A2625_01040 [candidate division WOR-1 bacterium RIFCSPHIGHO2_01_FULL_53_15]OGC10733.1 MAG: hypothetical protein A3D23_04550 [candidate division WOR-1 bacterium RIFCSPHIGHO2_02_FULL_53_26]
MPPASAINGALISWKPAVINDLDRHDRANWETAAWSNDDPRFNANWQYDKIMFGNGTMTLTIDDAGCPKHCDGKPFAAGEYRSLNELPPYGFFEARLQAAEGSGVVTSFFLSHTTSGGQEEIAFEILGKDCGRAQTNYIYQGLGGHEQMIDLGFNACRGLHNYGIEWRPDRIVWYVDGKDKRSVDGSPADLPSQPGKIIVNLWPTFGLDDWAGVFKYPGAPVAAKYDFIAYSPLDKKAAAAPATSRPAPMNEWVQNVESQDTGKKGSDGSALIRAKINLAKPIPDGFAKAKLQVCTGQCYPQGGPFDIKPGDKTVTVEAYLHHPLVQSRGEYALLKIHNPTTKQTIEIKFDMPIPGY